MSFHDAHINWILNRNSEVVFLIGFATGRVKYGPVAFWLYSFRMFIGVVKVEVLWTTGNAMKCEICNDGPPTGPAVYRVNKPGELPAVWRCEKHLTPQQSSTLDEEVVDVTRAIEESRKP